jgi:hypothetical protein
MGEQIGYNLFIFGCLCAAKVNTRMPGEGGGEKGLGVRPIKLYAKRIRVLGSSHVEVYPRAKGRRVLGGGLKTARDTAVGGGIHVSCSIAPRGKGGARQRGPMYVREKRERSREKMFRNFLKSRSPATASYASVL